LGRRYIVCDGADLAREWAQILPGKDEELVFVPREEELRARPPGFRSLGHPFTPEGLERLGADEGDEFAVIADDGVWLRNAVAVIGTALPTVPILVCSDHLQADELPMHLCIRLTGLRDGVRRDLDREFSHLTNLHRVAQIQRLFVQREKVAILLQPDPDPDGIACGFALRALLGRKSPTAPLVSFGEAKRPENVAMIQALGLEVRTIDLDQLEEFDGIALVDVQPNVFGDPIPARLQNVDLVIDHHPERSGWDAAIRDIRTQYGATSTILTEYLTAAGLEIRPRLATGLLYGIKSDTQLLGRGTEPQDIDAFSTVHASHSPALLRRIERPALPLDGLRALGRALATTRVEEGIHLLALGRVREDVIPQVADLGLQAEGAEWSIAAGVVGSDLVFSVRNVGYVRAAGEVVRAVVEGLGIGGGHRSMAKGIIPVKAFRAKYKRADNATIRRALHDAFVRAIHES
jgi:nanoRNase/pAp phosphatase (c-di-AMP/oligoRNAs hydrolase)